MDDPKRLQFGYAEPPGEDYPDRPAAFGLVVRDGKLACVRIEKPEEAPYYDLPGGALDPGETEAQALEREFVEETGLTVRAGEVFARAAQFIRKADGSSADNLCAFFTAEAVGENPKAKIEDDHTLVWLEPIKAIRDLRHDAHAWAATAWLRRAKR